DPQTEPDGVDVHEVQGARECRDGVRRPVLGPLDGFEQAPLVLQLLNEHWKQVPVHHPVRGVDRTACRTRQPIVLLGICHARSLQHRSPERWSAPGRAQAPRHTKPAVAAGFNPSSSLADAWAPARAAAGDAPFDRRVWKATMSGRVVSSGTGTTLATSVLLPRAKRAAAKPMSSSPVLTS